VILLEPLAKPRILVVGDVMLDRYWFGSVERISPEAPVPVVAVERVDERLGGAANVASNVKALGALCLLLSVVGEDDAGRSVKELLRSSGIDARLGADSKASTTIKLRIISRNQQLIRIDFERPPTHEVLEAVFADFRTYLEDTDAVLLSDYGKGGLHHIREMIALASEKSVPVMVDPKGLDFERYRGAYMLTPNRQEFAAVAGGWTSEQDLRDRAMRCLDRLDLQCLLITRSEQGMTLFRRDGSMRHQDAHAREVYDVSGAGDTVIATATTAMTAGYTDEQVVRLATVAAGVVVGKLGVATPDLDELRSALDAGSSDAQQRRDLS
jgi:D-glycero-beta-D-manno-heptose-7-phosphate kinase